MSGSLAPDIGNLSINTAGAFKNYIDSIGNVSDARNNITKPIMQAIAQKKLDDRFEQERQMKQDEIDYGKSRDLIADKRYDENKAILASEKNDARIKDLNTADALNALDNEQKFIQNKIAGEKKAAYDSLSNLSGQEYNDTKNQLDSYFSGQGAIDSGKSWLSNAENQSNIDSATVMNARINKEKLANDRADRAEDLRWKEKEYNLNLMKARVSGEPKYKGQAYTDPKTGAFVTTRSANEEQVLAQNGWTFGKNPNAGKADSTTGAKKDADKDYSAGYKKLEEKVLDYGSFDDSTALENLEMLKMLKINPNDVESMITKIEANTAFDKTLNYKDMNKYGPQIKSSDGKLLPLGDGIELIKKEGYITVFENGKPVLYKPTESKAIEEKLKEQEKTSKAPESISQKDIAPVKKTEDEVLNDRFISGVPSELITGNRTYDVKKSDPVIESYNSKSEAFKRDVSESQYKNNKLLYDRLYESRYK